eukprot:CAMPEP_0115888438 /NCGR_PEP_ID=MMETSP0287-20121206/32307_1 /TAXON_ID=412157 /ORGANISM="Chrysochromulina rotalis, Strain UIO044" /LENGTH=127 /DNA_ID=CAMNT_0003345121 /DNA_START=406 /DNA_END=787 /DNA_ORIENTATION=+
MRLGEGCERDSVGSTGGEGAQPPTACPACLRKASGFGPADARARWAVLAERQLPHAAVSSSASRSLRPAHTPMSRGTLTRSLMYRSAASLPAGGSAGSPVRSRVRAQRSASSTTSAEAQGLAVTIAS